jgi:hypothetical protein
VEEDEDDDDERGDDHHLLLVLGPEGPLRGVILEVEAASIAEVVVTLRANLTTDMPPALQPSP